MSFKLKLSLPAMFAVILGLALLFFPSYPRRSATPRACTTPLNRNCGKANRWWA